MAQNKKLYYVVTKDTECYDPNDGVETSTGTKVLTIYDIRYEIGEGYSPSFRGQVTCMLSDNSKEKVTEWFEDNGYSKDTETIEL